MSSSIFRSFFDVIKGLGKSREYQPLPADEVYELPISIHDEASPPSRFRRNPVTIGVRILTSPHLHRALLVILLLPVLYILSGGIPPTYSDIHQFEENLPQHRTSAVDRKYLRFEGTLWGLGLNNILQEQLLLSYIAYASNRSFVFSDYTWSHVPLPFTLYGWALRPTHMPLNTFIAGPAAGGDMASISLTQDVLDSAAETAPPDDIRAAHLSHFESVCPKKKQMRLSSTTEPRLSDGFLDGDALLNTWTDWIRGLGDEPCLVIDFSEKVVFDHLIFGSEKVIAMYPLLASTPILQDFKWSPLVQGAVDRNMAGIGNSSNTSQPVLIPGLVAVHLRRGDYDGHCRYLIKVSAQYQGMNRYPGITDHFDPYAAGDGTDEKSAHYLKHCLPDIPQIVQRLREVREDNPELALDRVYLLSNGVRWWLDDLWVELEKHGWKPVKEGMASSQDLDLSNEERFVSGAIDMAIAEQAEMFVGNGFSSLSGNIIMFRMAKGVDIGLNHLL